MFRGKNTNSLARRLFGSGFTALLFLCLPVFSQDPEFISFLTDTNLRYAIACSPDGKNVYAGGLYTLAAFRVSATGELETLQVLNNDYKGVKGLRGIINLTVSPDGRFLYAVSSGNQTLLIFSRNTTTGRLTLKQALQDNAFGRISGNFFAPGGHNSLFFSPDGKQLYWQLSALTVFQRNLNTGEVTKVQSLYGNDPVLGNLEVPSYLTIAPDGKHLYGGGRTHTKITIFARNSNTGILQFQNSFETNPNYAYWDLGSIAVSKSGEAIYASNYFAKKLLVLHRNRETGELRSLQNLNEDYPSHILPSPHNEQIYLKQLSGFAIYAKEDTSEHLAFKENFPIVYYQALPAGACISPLGNAIYMTGEGAGLTILQIDSVTAGLKVLQRWDNHNVGGLDRLQLPRSVAVSRNGKFVYVASSHGDSGINVFERDAAGGQVTFAGFYPIDRYDYGRMYASPEGQNLYLVRLGDQDKKLQVFSANEVTGEVKLVQTRQDAFAGGLGSEGANSITFSRNGRHAYLNDTYRIVVYERNLTTGELAPVQGLAVSEFQVGKIYGLALSPEGEFLYAIGRTPPNMPLFAEFQLSTFARDTTNGQLRFARQQSFHGLYPSAGLVVSPDHRHLYATLYNNGEDQTGVLLGFARNPISGLFTFVSVPDYRKYTQEGGEVLAISEDGRDVYFSEGTILAMMERNAETGALTERKLFVQNKNNVYGMSGYTGLALSPDNRHLYASAWDALGTFTTGRNSVSAVQEEETRATIPRTLVLEQNYPNPFSANRTFGNPSTVIGFQLPVSGHVTLKVFDVNGREVAKLVDEEMKTGEHAITFNAQSLPSGVYFFKLSAGKFSQTRKAALVR